MSSIFAVVAGRRAKWVVALIWGGAVGGSIAATLPTKLADAEKNESSSYLPGTAESTKVLDITKRLEGGELAPIVIVYYRDGGLTAADKKLVARDRKVFNSKVHKRKLRATSQFGKPIYSKDGEAALGVAQIKSDGEGDTITDPVEAVRKRLAIHRGGQAS